MYYDVRTYTARPNTLKLHLKLYAEQGYDIQRRHLGEPLAYLQTDAGDVNSYLHIWVYDSPEDRQAKRAALAADPDWAVYVKKSADAGYLVSQENKLMVPVPFFKP